MIKKRTLRNVLLMILLLMVFLWLVTSCTSNQPQNIEIQNKEKPEFLLSDPYPMPIPPSNGRGEAMEYLVPQYGGDYEADPYLKEAVVSFRRWEWSAMYTTLSRLEQEQPDYLDLYRLQAEAYLINKNYEAALSQLDQILRHNIEDIHALSVSIMIKRILGESEGEQQRLAYLEQISLEAARDIQALLEKVEEEIQIDGSNMPPEGKEFDAIVVFGQSPKSNGQPSSGMLERLEKTKEMALRYPNTFLIVSGGPVRTEFAEADVMRNWLVENGIASERILLDLEARDTVGNAIGIVNLLKEQDAHCVLAVATNLHLPRAVVTLSLYGDYVGYKMELTGVGNGEIPVENKGERLYTYVCAARAAGLFTKSDFQRYEIEGIQKE